MRMRTGAGIVVALTLVAVASGCNAVRSDAPIDPLPSATVGTSAAPAPSSGGASPTGPGSGASAPSPSVAVTLASPTQAGAAGSSPAGTSSSTGARHLTSWQSPSGNIACRYEPAGGQGPEWVACQIGDKSYPRPGNAAECHGAGAGDNAIVLARGAAPGWLCAGDYWGGPQVAVLAYGHSVRNGTLACVSQTQGMTCEDTRSGHGFLLSRQSWTMH